MHEPIHVLTSDRNAAEAVTNFQVALQRQRELTQHELGEHTQSARLIPGFADVHLNYGAALACRGQSAEAAAEFREAQRLRPQGYWIKPKAKDALPVRVKRKPAALNP